MPGRRCHGRPSIAALPRRALTAAGLALGTAALGVAVAPAALAAPAVIVSPSTVAPGADFTLSAVDCVSVDPDNEAVAVFLPAVDPQWADAQPAEVDGTWTMTPTAPAEAGTYEYAVFCDWYTGGFDYANITITVAAPVAAPVAPPAPTAPTAPTGAIRGASAVTPGVAGQATAGTTGASAPAGRTVVKVLTGFKPGEVVTVTLHSTPQRVGSFTADASGTVRVESTVPAGTTAGDHTLVYEGNQGTYFQEAFTVAAAPLATAGSGEPAYTGASVALPLGLGLGALALGGGLVLAGHRRSAGATQA